MMIPYNKTFIAGKELFNIARAVIENNCLSGNGAFTQKCHDWLETNLGCQKALLTHSCTAALEMAAILCGITSGDEVIMPSFTFVSTANAFVLRGGVPVFIDIRPDTLNMDETRIEAAVTKKTKAIVPVHYAGVPCAMDIIIDLAEKYHLFVIEDAAQALLSTYNGSHLGTMGDLGTLSFHETKNIISGEGGALLINNEKLSARAEIIWEKGTNRKAYFNGRVDKYTWVDIGSSFLPGEMVAAFLCAQLEMAETIIAKRCSLFNTYYAALGELAQQGKIRLPQVHFRDKSNGHIFYIITGSLRERTRLIDFLNKHSINAVFHYIPLHASPAGKKYGRTPGKMDNTNALSDRVLRLPLFYEMTDLQVHEVATQIKRFYGQK
jgi:dTDP-4-amino-4,6-dideoxygalactose transaminase